MCLTPIVDTIIMPTPQLQRAGEKEKEPEQVCLFAKANYRNQMRRFGIKTDDRRRHMYVIGKTGMGKTTMLENMVLHDIYSGNAVGIVDPHGDFAEKIIDYVPSNRINDVVYINPADEDYPMGFNILEVQDGSKKHLIAAGLMNVFKKIWPDVWSSRMEYILNNTLLALLDYPGSTLLGINRMLSDKKYRKRVVAKIQDPVVKAFWTGEFASWEDRYRKEAVAAIQNKVGQFLSSSVMRNMLAQVKSTFDIRGAMDSGKIIVINLSKGRIGEDNMRLLGGMLITKIQLAAMERVDTLEKDRRDFFLYVDEFQNFATESFAGILSEARKYRLSLIMAHQYIAQLDETVRDAVFGNVGTIVSFRVGAADAILLAPEYAPVFMEEDIVNLTKYNIFLKLMIDGVASQPFSAQTMAPIGSPTGSTDKVIRVSRERYAKSKESIEEKILRWSGMDDGGQQEEAAKADKPAADVSEKKIKPSLSPQTEEAPKEEKPEASISLSELLPEKTEPEQPAAEVIETTVTPELPPEESPAESPPPEIKGPEDMEADIVEQKVEPAVEETQPKQQEIKPKEASDGESQPKKKKRRRRRRKKKSSTEVSEGETKQQQPVREKSEQTQESPPGSPSEPPKATPAVEPAAPPGGVDSSNTGTLSPDITVTFD